MAFFRKRKVTLSSMRGNTNRAKRRRVFKKRPFHRRRRVQTLTSQTTNARTIQKYGGRKLNKRNWRNMLWRDSLGQFKYKSTLSGVSTVSTPNNLTQKTLAALISMSDVAGSMFWQPTGGLQPTNFGFVAPTLVPESIILRGGMIGISVCARQSAANSCRIQIYLAYPKQQGRSADDTASSNTFTSWLVANIGSYDLMYTLQDLPDYQEYFHPPILTKEALVHPGENVEVYYKMRIRKIDVSQWWRGGLAPYWFVCVSQTSNVDGGAETLDVVISHDVSFTTSSS